MRFVDRFVTDPEIPAYFRRADVVVLPYRRIDQSGVLTALAFAKATAGRRPRARSTMSERDGYIPGVPCWIDTTQPDPDAAADFYGGLFGWEFEDVMPPGSPGKYLIGRIRGGDVAAVGSQTEGGPPMAAWNTYVWVQSADETAASARDAGGTVLTEPFDIGDSGRMTVLADPAGAAFCAWQAKQHRGARIVNETAA